MKYIFHVEPDDFILAGRAIEIALKTEFTSVCGVDFENGPSFSIRRNKLSISVWRN